MLDFFLFCVHLYCQKAQVFSFHIDHIARQYGSLVLYIVIGHRYCQSFSLSYSVSSNVASIAIMCSSGWYESIIHCFNHSLSLSLEVLHKLFERYADSKRYAIWLQNGFYGSAVISSCILQCLLLDTVAIWSTGGFRGLF